MSFDLLVQLQSGAFVKLVEVLVKESVGLLQLLSEMVQLRTKLTVLDNSGVKIARRIQVMGVVKRPGHVGRRVVASVQKATPESPMKKGSMVRGYMATTVYGVSRKNGMKVRFPENGVVLVNKKLEPVASRVTTPMPSDLRFRGRSKRLTLGSTVI